MLKRTFKCLTTVVLKELIVWKCSGSTPAAVWHRLTAEDTEAGLVAACQLVKTAVVCQSVGSSSQIEDFQRSLWVLMCCADFLHL